MTNMLKRLWTEQEGQGMTEYGLILGIIAIAVIGALIAMKNKIVALFNTITTNNQF